MNIFPDYYNNSRNVDSVNTRVPIHQRRALFCLFKIPVYGAELLLLKIYSLCLSILMVSKAIISNDLKEKISRHKITLRFHGVHLDMKCLEAWNQYQYQGYLMCPMRNIGRVDVLKNQKDLQAAKKYAQILRDKFRFQYFNKILPQETTLDMAKKIEKNNPEIIDDFVNKVIPSDDKFESSVGGVCGLATISFASQYLNHHQRWESIVRDAREGVVEEIAGLQSLYVASLPLIGENALDYVSSLCQMRSRKIEGIDPKENNAVNIKKLCELENGVYAINFLTKSYRHVILMSKEREGISIIDPNIGLLSCTHEQLQKLISKIISSYSFRKNYSSHQIEVKQFHSISNDQEWTLHKDEKGNLKWGFIGDCL